MTASLIDICKDMQGDGGEVDRMVAIAMTRYEEAAMWAVKAATS
jgi:hypothetical protein